MKKYYKKRSIISLVLTVLFLFSFPAFSEGKQEVKKAPTLVWLTSIQGGRSTEEQPLFEKEIYRLTGIKVKIIKTAQNYNEKLESMLGSGAQLDIVYLTADLFEKLWPQHLFTPLTEWIEKSPVLGNPEIIPKSEWNKLRRSDGQIYAVFNNKSGSGTLPIVRKDWMDKLGFAAPGNLDEYYQLLKAFKTQDPDGNGINDTYGLAVGYTTYDDTPIFGAYGLMRGFVKDRKGKLYAPWATEKAIPVYNWFRKLYREGILEPNFVTNHSSNFQNLFMTNKVGMLFYWAGWVALFNQQVKAKNPRSTFEAEGLVPPEGPGGRLLRAAGGGLMCIPKTSKHKKEAFKLLEFWNTHAGNILGSLGILNYDYKITDDNKYILTKIGMQHAMDHGSALPKSLKWENPIVKEGIQKYIAAIAKSYEDAAAIVVKYGHPQLITPYEQIWETIVRSETARIILGNITAEQGIENMQKRFKEKLGDVYQ